MKILLISFHIEKKNSMLIAKLKFQIYSKVFIEINNLINNYTHHTKTQNLIKHFKIKMDF